MKFLPTPIAGAFVIEQEPRGDERGFFARAFCIEELSAAGLETTFVQINNAFTGKKGTLRGFHYQLPPAAETKIFRCIRGALYDMIVDLRPDSPTYLRSFGVELTAANRLQLYVPKGCAHGYLTLEEDTEALYMSSAPYSAASERGLRYNDPSFKLSLPIEPVVVSAKDQAWLDYDARDKDASALRGLLG
ncbi:MAG: dTDP-4-dehydrorhamnose 3,5-epimerase family protein [Hyphomicrobiaceae bacterium]